MNTQIQFIVPNMKKKFTLMTRLMGVLVLLMAFIACDKEKGQSIDYNTLTEQRILEVSEQKVINDDDIASLERLLESVTDNNLRTKYTSMITGVKVIKDFIPSLNKLRTDVDVNFQDLYKELEAQLKTVTDDLPRKAKLDEELKIALANYSTEEYTYIDYLMDEGGLKSYLEDNFNIKPITGKPYSYLRTDIDKVDSLDWYIHANDAKDGDLQGVLKTFKNLTYLKTNTDLDRVVDINHMTKLETLIIGMVGLRDKKTAQELKFDQLNNLKHLEFGVGLGFGKGISPIGETLDFTNRHPLLETLVLQDYIVKDLTTLLLPDKQHLTGFQIIGMPGYTSFPKIKRVVIEGNGIRDVKLAVGSATNKEIEEVTVSGLTSGTGNETNPPSFTLGGEDMEVRIKKLTLSDIKSRFVGFGGLDISASPIDFSVFSGTKSLSITAFKVGAKAGTLKDLQNFDKIVTSLEILDLQGLSFPDGVLDISKWSNLKGGYFSRAEENPVKTIRMTKAQQAMQDPGDGTCDGCGFYYDDGTSVELVD